MATTARLRAPVVSMAAAAMRDVALRHGTGTAWPRRAWPWRRRGVDRGRVRVGKPSDRAAAVRRATATDPKRGRMCGIPGLGLRSRRGMELRRR